MIRKIALSFLIACVVIWLGRICFKDFDNSVIPGWHTTIASQYFIIKVSSFCWLTIVAFIYFFYLKNEKIKPYNYIVYGIFTIPLIVTILIYREIINWLQVDRFFLTSKMFVAGQLIFLHFLYFKKTKKSQLA